MLNKFRNFLFGSSFPSETVPSANGKASKSLAKSRLSFVLVQDRTGLNTEEMAKFKSEMLGVIEKYFAIDEQKFDINYKREGDSTTLFINSPVIVKRKLGSNPNQKTGNGKPAEQRA